MGVWIETRRPSWVIVKEESHPTWVCGLKHRKACWESCFCSHTLRGCVDWNFQDGEHTFRIKSHTLRGCVDWNWPWNVLNDKPFVTPYVGVWIETLSRPDYPSGSISHTLRGCVDWNFDYLFYFCFHKVTPCVGIYGLEHCSLVGQVYGRTVSIRPLMYFSPGFWFCYDWKKHVQARMLIFCLFSFVVSPRWQYIGT